MMGMGQQMPMRRPPMGPSPMTAGRPNPMAGGNFLPAPRTGPPPQVPPWAQHPQGIQAGGGGGGSFPTRSVDPRQFAPPQGGGGAQGNFPTQQVFGGGYQGAPPWMGGGGGPIQMMDNANAGGLQTGVFDPNMPLAPGVKSYGGGMFSGPATPPPGGFGGGPQGMSDAMMHPFAPRNRGAQSIGPQMQNSLAAMQGAMGGGASPVGPQYQRRFPGALQRGILQGMGQPPQATPPAPYGGQQFRMW